MKDEDLNQVVRGILIREVLPRLDIAQILINAAKEYRRQHPP